MDKVNCREIRKEAKRSARGVLKRHYWALIALCLAAAFFNLEFVHSTGSLAISSEVTDKDTEEELEADVDPESGAAGMQTSSLYDVLALLAQGRVSDAYTYSKDMISQFTKTSEPTSMFGRTNGVLASVFGRLAHKAPLLFGALGFSRFI